MNAQNYDKLMQNQIEKLGGRKTLLLHCCCAPCSSACLERLKDCFDITVFFYNPNIDDKEYFKRKEELIKLITHTGWAKIAEVNHDTNEFYPLVKGLEKQPEGGKRCEVCFKTRLEKTAEFAKAGGFDYFTTTLTISPLKNAKLINEIGEKLSGGKTQWLYSDFKKRDGYLNSIKLSEKYNLYRQNYCGCAFSRADT